VWHSMRKIHLYAFQTEYVVSIYVLGMIWFLIAQIVTVILDVLNLHLSTDPDKALELLVLRQQIRILERQ
jgi:hypothetical protein